VPVNVSWTVSAKTGRADKASTSDINMVPERFILLTFRMENRKLSGFTDLSALELNHLY
jgi:hypothetical protein